jgi:hypothetical protein
MSSTELLLAASNSWMFIDRCSLKARQLSQFPQGVPSASGVWQFMAFAKMRAQVVFPTPLGPQNK